MSAAGTAMCYKLTPVIECRCINQNSFEPVVCTNKCCGGSPASSVREITWTTAWSKHGTVNKLSLELFIYLSVLFSPLSCKACTWLSLRVESIGFGLKGKTVAVCLRPVSGCGLRYVPGDAERGSVLWSGIILLRIQDRVLLIPAGHVPRDGGFCEPPWSLVAGKRAFRPAFPSPPGRLLQLFHAAFFNSRFCCGWKTTFSAKDEVWTSLAWLIFETLKLSFTSTAYESFWVFLKNYSYVFVCLICSFVAFCCISHRWVPSYGSWLFSICVILLSMIHPCYCKWQCFTKTHRHR